MTEELTEHFNNIYTKLHIGRVTRKGNGLYQITTGGWSDDEEILCNPIICRWCKYSNNGKRDPGDPARGITLCDGCRYNKEFEHIEIKVRW